MYDLVRLAKQGLIDFPMAMQHMRLVFCYAHACAVYLRLHLL